jgi:hypothetical protein
MVWKEPRAHFLVSQLDVHDIGSAGFGAGVDKLNNGLTLR